MSKHNLRFVLFAVLIGLLSCAHVQRDGQRAFTFIVTADMRYAATEEYRYPWYFLGVCEAIREVGKGAFMVSPGDVDPPQSVREMLTQVFGADYLWYPVMGNHELEAASNVEYLRQYNKGGASLPNIVRKGPAGCEETTYSFDWGNTHFVVLNQYYDGSSDMGTDGDVVPELLAWLEADLAANTKKQIIVFGHEPIIAVPDIDNGRLRHQGDSLDKYPENAFNFHRLLLKYGVTAYIHGHTHSASFSKLNGLWQIDAGHCRGMETDPPEQLLLWLAEAIEEGRQRGQTEDQSIREFFNSKVSIVKKALEYMELSGGLSSKELSDEQAFKAFSQFYLESQKDSTTRNQYFQSFWESYPYSKSTFLKFYVDSKGAKVEIYRDRDRGRQYFLRHTEILD